MYQSSNILLLKFGWDNVETEVFWYQGYGKYNEKIIEECIRASVSPLMIVVPRIRSRRSLLYIQIKNSGIV